jgi:hypothetical protein
MLCASSETSARTAPSGGVQTACHLHITRGGFDKDD